jgi:hypothetical protein
MNNNTNDLESRLVTLVQSALVEIITTQGAVVETMTPDVTKRIVGTILSSVCAASVPEHQLTTIPPRSVVTDDVTFASPKRSWATSRDIRPVVGRARKPRPTSSLVS